MSHTHGSTEIADPRRRVTGQQLLLFYRFEFLKYKIQQRTSYSFILRIFQRVRGITILFLYVQIHTPTLFSLQNESYYNIYYSLNKRFVHCII